MNGLILAKYDFDDPWLAYLNNMHVHFVKYGRDGQKMSKRLRNYPPPTDVLRSNGADALRLYLVDSPAVRAETLRFSEEGVQVLNLVLFVSCLTSCFFHQFH